MVDEHQLQMGCSRITWGALKDTESQTERSPGQIESPEIELKTCENVLSAKGGISR